jgi:hypothetical protein
MGSARVRVRVCPRQALGAAGVSEAIYSLIMANNDFLAESVRVLPPVGWRARSSLCHADLGGKGGHGHSALISHLDRSILFDPAAMWL